MDLLQFSPKIETTDFRGNQWSQSLERIAADPKFNQHWGYLNEDGTDISSERQNFYHKPVTNLNWDFNISDKTELSTVAYASWGRVPMMRKLQ